MNCWADVDISSRKGDPKCHRCQGTGFVEYHNPRGYQDFTPCLCDRQDMVPSAGWISEGGASPLVRTDFNRQGVIKCIRERI